MAINYSATTELEAVNTMLAVIGESPVNSLYVSGMIDVANAVATLHETSRKIQQKGWYVNTEKDYPLNIDINGFIYLPENTLKMDLSYNSVDVEPVQKGNRLYDKKNHTFVFKNSLKFDIVWFLPFTDLPESLRSYITIAAARAFQKRFYSSDSIDGFTKEDEMYAKIDAEHADGDVADYNMLYDSSVNRILMR